MRALFFFWLKKPEERRGEPKYCLWCPASPDRPDSVASKAWLRRVVNSALHWCAAQSCRVAVIYPRGPFEARFNRHVPPKGRREFPGPNCLHHQPGLGRRERLNGKGRVIGILDCTSLVARAHHFFNESDDRDPAAFWCQGSGK